MKSLSRVWKVTQSCLTLCDPMVCSTPGFPVLHHLPEFAQAHVHWVSDAIQPSYPLSSPSPLAPNPSQHQSLFQWLGFSHQVAKVSIGASASASVLEMNIQGWFSLGLTSLTSLQSKRFLKTLPQHFNSKESILLHSLFFMNQLSHPYMTTGKTIALTRWNFVGK